MSKELNDKKPNTAENSRNKNKNNKKNNSVTVKGNVSVKKNNKKRKRKNNNEKKSNAKSGSQLLPKLGVKTPHSSLPVLKVKKVKEPLITCTYCGKVIENIASAIKPDENSIYHFDCMLEKLKKDESLADGEKISYIGRGNFAIVSTNSDNEIVFRKIIEVETVDAFSKMKKYIEGAKI